MARPESLVNQPAIDDPALAAQFDALVAAGRLTPEERAAGWI